MSNVLLSCLLSLPTALIMIICGVWFIKEPPSDINGMIGYKTEMSCKNPDTWLTAHYICGKFWLVSGIICLILPPISITVLSGVISGDALFNTALFFTYADIAMLIAAIPVTESRLKRIFNKDGSRK